MAYAFDTLGYAKRLRDSGLTAEAAEAHAEAARDFIMTELVTRSDLDTTRRVLETAMQNTELRLEGRVDRLESGEEKRIDRLDGRIDRLGIRIDSLELRLLVRLGGLIAIGIAILAAIIKL